MNQTHVTLCIALMTAIAGHAVGGEISPPDGPIGSTMRSLDQIEPRVCINDLAGDEGAVHVITEPGRYFLSGDVFGEPGKSGIVVRLDEDSDDDSISIDMDGFSLTGVIGSGNGIWVPEVANVRVERFNVRQEFGQQSGVRGWDGDGVLSEGADAVALAIDAEDNGGAGYRVKKVAKFKAGKALADTVKIANNGGGGGGGVAVGGILVEGCPDTTIFGVDASRNFGTGVSVTFLVPEKTVKKVSLHEVRANNNLGDGIVIDHRVPDDLSVSIRRASMDANSGDGLRIVGSGVGEESMDMDMSIDEMYVGHNGGYGANIHALSAPSIRVHITDSTFATNVLSGLRIFGDEGARIRTLRATRCVASSNGGSGFEIRADQGFFDTCVASENSVHGYDVSGSPDAGGVTYKKGYDYYKAMSNNNAANGINGNGCTVTMSVCHLISNGGNGGDITDGEARVIDSVCVDNGGSGLRTNDSPLYTGNTTCGENALYGVHSTSTNGMGTTITMNDCVMRANSSGGARVEGGHYCGKTDHFIANGGGGVGSGLDAIDVESVCLTDSTSTGNTGAGVRINNSASGISPHSLTLETVRSSGNGGSGILVAEAAYGQIERCVTNNNGGEGVNCPASTTDMTIQRCVSSGNAFNGFNLTGLGHILVNNTAAGNVAGAIKAVVPGTTVGPSVDEGGAATNGNPGGNYVR